MPALTALAGAALTQLPSLLKSNYEKDLERDILELERKKDAGQLGLGEQERSVLEGSLESKGLAAGERAAQQRAQFLAGSGGAIAGQALEQVTGQQAIQTQQLTQIQQAVEEQDINARLRQEDELRQKQAADAEYNAQRLAAITGVAGAGLESFVSETIQNKYIEGAAGGIASKYGISEHQAESLMRLQGTRPDAFSYLDLLREDETEGGI